MAVLVAVVAMAAVAAMVASVAGLAALMPAMSVAMGLQGGVRVMAAAMAAALSVMVQVLAGGWAGPVAGPAAMVAPLCRQAAMVVDREWALAVEAAAMVEGGQGPRTVGALAPRRGGICAAAVPRTQQSGRVGAGAMGPALARAVVWAGC